jgi:hypothetical protein
MRCRGLKQASLRKLMERVPGCGTLGRSGFEPKLPGICLVSVLVLFVFAWRKMASYQLLSRFRSRAGRRRPRSAGENGRGSNLEITRLADVGDQIHSSGRPA